MPIKNSEIIELDEKESALILGKMFAKEIQKCVSQVTKLDTNFHTMKEKLINTYPKYYKEVCDRASGAKVDSDKYLTIVSYELREKAMEKCTDIMIKKDNGTILLGHNEDGQYNSNNSAIIKYITKNGWYIEFSCIDSLAGTTYWWNSKGLIFTMNYIHTKYIKTNEISAWFVLRDIIECGSLDEVLEKIKKVKSASGFNVNLVDTNTNKIYSVESNIDRVDVAEITDKYVHTNHFIHLEKGYSPDDNNTFNRFKHCTAILDKLDKNTVSAEDIKTILEYKNDDYMYTIHVDKGMRDDITGSLFIFDGEQKHIQIYDYINDRKLFFKI
jgi:hypothetical protein